ncbi:MAG: cell division protein ZapE [Pseudomonadota bacterium]
MTEVIIGSVGSGPAARYSALLETGKLEPDGAQQRLVELLDQRFVKLTQTSKRWLRRARFVPGLYIHGQVGRGKTLLMDLFAHSLNDAGVAVVRSHFHRFMDDVHRELNQLDRRRNPLATIAGRLAKRARVICFDEFHVEDIANAMLLGELTRYWFENELTLIATSNTAPADLYANGLQRQRFIPAIENIEKYCDVVELNAPQDFRLRELQRHPTWHQPLSPQVEQSLTEEFEALSPDAVTLKAPIEVRGRELAVHARAGSLLWADFHTLCEQPRGAGDYVELACRFSTLFLSEIPQMDDHDNNAAKRFVHLIDECYDRSVKLIASAAAPIEQIYQGRQLAGPFERTTSRLIEMQSQDYLARPHRP